MDIKLESTYKGTRILFGELAKKKRDILTSMSNILIENGYQEIMIPIIQKQETFSNKVGNENQNIVQQMSTEVFK